MKETVYRWRERKRVARAQDRPAVKFQLPKSMNGCARVFDEVLRPALNRTTRTIGMNVQQLENELWEAADQLRANSKLTAAEYAMPVLGLIFLRHADNRFKAYLPDIEADIPPQVPAAQRETLTAGLFRARRPSTCLKLRALTASPACRKGERRRGDRQRDGRD